MPIKELVTIAAKVYELTKGKRKILEELQKLDESQLPNAILELKEKKSDVGTSVTKNLIDVLIHVVKVQENRETPDFASKAIAKLSEEGIKILPSQKGWLTSLFVSTTPNPLEEEYKSFISSSNKCVNDLSVSSHKALDFVLKDEHFLPQPELEKKPDPLEELKNRIHLLEDEIEQSKQQLIKKENEIKTTREELTPYKDKYTKLIASEQNREQIRQVLYCFILELEFEQAFKYTSSDVLSVSAQEKKEAIAFIYESLSGIFSRILVNRNFELHLEAIKNRLETLIRYVKQRETMSIVMQPTLFFRMKQLPERIFYNKAIEMVEYLETDKLKNMPTELSAQVFAIYQEAAEAIFAKKTMQAPQISRGTMGQYSGTINESEYCISFKSPISSCQ